MTPSDAIDTDPTQGLRLCRHRSRWFIWLISIWALVIIFRMSQIMLFNRERYRADIDRESWHRGMIPAQRGRILDSTGIPLAWSVRRLRLHWDIPQEPDLACQQWDRLSLIPQLNIKFDKTALPALYGKKVLLVDGISAGQAPALSRLTREISAFALSPYFVRYQVGSAQFRQTLGRTIQKNGVEIGISGYEKTHDSILRGHPGIFRVMVDADGDWIMSTWEKVQEMQPGYDVFLPVRGTHAH